MKMATNRNPSSDPGLGCPQTWVLRMQTRNFAIINPLGLHARACARIVHIASRFRSNISLVVKGRRASAGNIVAVMLLTASVGTTVRLEIDGPDEVEAMREIAALFHDGYGER
jgi:phosphocarrier protein HPr